MGFLDSSQAKSIAGEVISGFNDIRNEAHEIGSFLSAHLDGCPGESSGCVGGGLDGSGVGNNSNVDVL